MTASRMWALIVGLIVLGGGLVGTVYYRHGHPDSEIAKLVTPLTQPAPSPSKPAVLPGGPDVGPQPGATKPEAAKLEAAKPTPEPASGNGEPPHFDVVRVEPTGESVLAGKGDPNAKIALVEQGKVVAETKADPSGHFVILPPPLTPGDHDLTLRQTTDGKPIEESKQNVAVSVPQKSNGPVIVALAEPGKPTRVLSAPSAAGTAATASAPPTPTPREAAAPPHATDGSKVAIAKPETAITPPSAIVPKGPDLAIRTAELENGNGFYATGVAVPGTPVEVYLNGAHLAQVLTGADAQWSVTIRRGLTGGHYIVRADAIGADQKVIARVEVPFDVPVAMAEASKPETPKPETPKTEKPKTETPKTETSETEAQMPEESVETPKSASVDPAARGTEPPFAPNPSELGLNPSPSVSAAPAPDTNLPSIVPTPRPDIAAAAKAAAQAAPDKAPPVLAVAPPAPAGSAAGVPAPDKMAIAPAKPADAPPTLSATVPSVAPPKRAEMSAATGTAPAMSVSQAKPAAGASTANAVIEQVETALVVSGDNLWNISRAKLGQGMRYTQIYAANASQIRNPRLIYPGQVFVMPQN